MSGRVRLFFEKINAKWPWLKIAAPVLLIIVVVFAIVKAKPPVGDNDMVRIAPMLQHVQTPERPARNFEGKKLVALTFDDGPSPATTPRLLDILKEQGVPATFFELGSLVRRNAWITRRALMEGHEIASHTMWHQNLARLSLSAAQADVAEANAAFIEAIGYVPELVRPPYGSVNGETWQALNATMITWSVDTLDWKYRNTDSIVSNLVNQISDGGIVLMHDIHATSVDAVPTVIVKLREMGYEFVTVSELIKMRGAKTDKSTLYAKFAP